MKRLSPSAFARFITSVAALLVAGCRLSAPTQSVKSLENLAGDHVVHRCHGSFAVDGAARIEAPGALGATVRETLTAVPAGLQRIFFAELGGKIFVSPDTAAACLGAKPDRLQRLLADGAPKLGSCWVASQGHPVIYLSDRDADIRHALVRAFGFVVGERLMTGDYGMNLVKAATAKALLADIAASSRYSLSVFNGVLAPVLLDERMSARTRDELLDRTPPGPHLNARDQFYETAFADAFDQYFCSDETRAKMAAGADFARTGAVFQGVANDLATLGGTVSLGSAGAGAGLGLTGRVSPVYAAYSGYLTYASQYSGTPTYSTPGRAGPYSSFGSLRLHPSTTGGAPVTNYPASFYNNAGKYVASGRPGWFQWVDGQGRPTDNWAHYNGPAQNGRQWSLHNIAGTSRTTPLGNDAGAPLNDGARQRELARQESIALNTNVGGQQLAVADSSAGADRTRPTPGKVDASGLEPAGTGRENRPLGDGGVSAYETFFGGALASSGPQAQAYDGTTTNAPGAPDGSISQDDQNAIDASSNFGAQPAGNGSRPIPQTGDGGYANITPDDQAAIEAQGSGDYPSQSSGVAGNPIPQTGDGAYANISPETQSMIDAEGNAGGVPFDVGPSSEPETATPYMPNADEPSMPPADG